MHCRVCAVWMGIGDRGHLFEEQVKWTLDEIPIKPIHTRLGFIRISKHFDRINSHEVIPTSRTGHTRPSGHNNGITNGFFFLSLSLLLVTMCAIHTLTHLNPNVCSARDRRIKVDFLVSLPQTANLSIPSLCYSLPIAFDSFPRASLVFCMQKQFAWSQLCLYVRFRMQFDSLQVLNNRLHVVRCFRPPPLFWFASLLLVIITVLASRKCAGCFSSHFPCGFDYWVEWPQ